jgi:hypothetical protein
MKHVPHITPSRKRQASTLPASANIKVPRTHLGAGPSSQPSPGTETQLQFHRSHAPAVQTKVGDTTKVGDPGTALAATSGQNIKPNPIDLCSSGDTLEEDSAVQQHLEQIQSTLNAVTPQAVANIAAAQDKQARDYSGQQVSITERMPINSFVKRKVPITSKLNKGWEGPYQVISYDERQTTAVLPDSAGNQKSRHVSLIAPYSTGDT